MDVRPLRFELLPNRGWLTAWALAGWVAAGCASAALWPLGWMPAVAAAGCVLGYTGWMLRREVGEPGRVLEYDGANWSLHGRRASDVDPLAGRSDWARRVQVRVVIDLDAWMLLILTSAGGRAVSHDWIALSGRSWSASDWSRLRRSLFLRQARRDEELAAGAWFS